VTLAAARDRLVFAFNTFYSEFISSLSRRDDHLKRRLKKHYHVMNRRSDEYMTWFHGEAAAALPAVFDDAAYAADEGVQGTQVARGLRVKDLGGDAKADVRLLCAIAWMFGKLLKVREDGDGEGDGDEEDEGGGSGGGGSAGWRPSTACWRGSWTWSPRRNA
jgi:hypothetical protein